ncbi:Superfamily II DNA and RNA helicase [Colwellia chukchiensis]|uniref:Superfamily II DNA and RNA helicase n=1 Tax=Colwellia chukchiensis TaxID=641665 RepID=A0A1H7LUZ3_9GAMM|nr:DEAD/DEAH box helicase [Colwellia chukchiensis]SEL02689.1 Superfamily II DNA and RNA helicase [Colwellia chukchiensis]
MEFSDFGLDRKIMSTVEHLGFNKPTEIQQQAIPAAMTGQDLIASSKTGSGKTLAFIIPAMQRLMKNRPLSKRDPRVVILTPTRELAKQVFNQLRIFTAGSQFKAVLILGGENFNDQVKTLAKDPHFIVATPGRLADHLTQRHFHLNGLELLILDEADRMLDLGFAEQLNQINQAADHRKRQTLMFSATLDHAQVNDFALALLKKPKRIAIGSAHTEHKDIIKRFYLCDNLTHKEQLLTHLIAQEDHQQMIIFTATRADTDRLSTMLTNQGLSTVALSGELSQSQRNQIMAGFSKGLQKILITTDLASRGLDLVNVSHVINFDMPKHTEEFVHRIGRTGRAGSKGFAISLVGPKDWLSFKNVEGFLQQKLKFDVIDGLKAKFKGLKAKQAPTTKKVKTAKKPAVTNQSAKAKSVVRKSFLAQDAGDLPVLKRKQAIAPQDIDSEESK